MTGCKGHWQVSVLLPCQGIPLYFVLVAGIFPLPGLWPPLGTLFPGLDMPVAETDLYAEILERPGLEVALGFALSLAPLTVVPSTEEIRTLCIIS